MFAAIVENRITFLLSFKMPQLAVLFHFRRHSDSFIHMYDAFKKLFVRFCNKHETLFAGKTGKGLI